MNKLTDISRKLFLPALAFALAGCSSGPDMQELNAFVQSELNRSPGPIEPLPQFVYYEPFSYSAANLRGPFDAPIDITSVIQRDQGQDVSPDVNRVKEELESFSMGSLQMVGSLSRGAVMWALVLDENGEVHRVMRGNYMGKNHGRVISATETQIELIEIVPSGDGGWIERPQTLSLQTTGE